MQLNTIATTRLKSLTADGIETLSVLDHRSIKDSPLLRGRIQLYHNCSVHADSISYIPTFVNREEYSVCGQLSFLPMPKGRGIQKGTLMKGTRKGLAFANWAQKVVFPAIEENL
jgi:hypothetical protein